ncbi:MAG: hypothetical protein QUV05_23870 [Phycisphaerae bacterium]|nr:hypothetical protein [Phycisphaerae bacterium]
MPKRRRNTAEKKAKRPVVMARLVSLKDADRSFDIEFWRRVGVEGRWRAMREMVKEVYRMRGEDVPELRLQRSVQHVIKNKRLAGRAQDLLDVRNLTKVRAKRKRRREPRS